jgi:hypothetical protein
MQQDILLTALPAECTDAGRLARSFAVGGRRFCTFRFRRLAASLAAFACAGLCFAQQFITLDAALVNSLAYLQSKIPKGSKVLLLNFPAPTKTLSKYLSDKLTAHIVNSGSFVVVERNNLEALQKELNFQMSGEVSGAEGYRLYRSAFAESAYTLLAEVSSTAYVDSGVAADNGYYYKASSVDFGREGVQSAYAYAAVRLPDAPADIRAERYTTRPARRRTLASSTRPI